MNAPATIATIVFDAADPAKLAAFYAQLTGWEVSYQDEDFHHLGNGPIKLGFQRVADYRGPGWPDPAKHAHLDLNVTNLDAAVETALGLGAQKPEFQPGDSWVVLTDPEGHPFCLVS
ncbi:VOC family protein [Asanoa iriomotensis]|uniref:Glyoxalase n=1 Tax=Asanoa iriomotensis TaxID=234613 RepID=A0ABQ4CCW0_9ACTN|nr:VOC family protein [Asanoa iriomotensis]GIF60311.1 glyoxalase [Asanoa iriomotensis]